VVKAKMLFESVLDISERYRVELKVFEVKVSEKYPEGFKARFALIDTVDKAPRLLIDNHAPFGFHIHTQLPKDKNSRTLLETTDYTKALDKFWELTQEILNNEDKATKH
jgi:hypothetical protein